jgi:hypothetical protein
LVVATLLPIVPKIKYLCYFGMMIGTASSNTKQEKQ